MEKIDPDFKIRGMRYGDPDKDKLPFSELRATQFTPTLYSDAYINEFGKYIECGPAALASVIGGCPMAIQAKLLALEEKNFPDEEHVKGVSMKSMLELLNSLGIVAQEVTYCDLHPTAGVIEERVEMDNVMLISHPATKTELMSWSIIWDNKQFHKLEMSELTKKFLINNPINEMALLWHPSWKRASPWKSLADAMVSGLEMKKRPELVEPKPSMQHPGFNPFSRTPSIRRKRR